jgi:hypothetical protein
MADLESVTATLQRQNEEALAASLENASAVLQSAGARTAFEELTNIIESQEEKTVDEYKKTQQRVAALQKSIKNLEGLSRAESAALTQTMKDAQNSLNQNANFKATVGNVVKDSAKGAAAGLGNLVSGALSQSPILAFGAGFISERVSQFKERKAAQKAEEEERNDRLAAEEQKEQKEMGLLRETISNEDAVRASNKNMEEIQRDAAMQGVSEQELIDQEKDRIIRRAQADKDAADKEEAARKNLEKIAERYGISISDEENSQPAPTPNDNITTEPNQDIPTTSEESETSAEAPTRRGRGPDLQPRARRDTGGNENISTQTESTGDTVQPQGDLASEPTVSQLTDTQLEFQPFLEKIYDEMVWQRENADNPNSLEIEEARELRRERKKRLDIERAQLKAMQEGDGSGSGTGGGGNEGGILDTLGDMGGLVGLAGGGAGLLGMFGLGKNGFLTKGLKSVTGKFGKFGGKIGKLGAVVAGAGAAIGGLSTLFPDLKFPKFNTPDVPDVNANVNANEMDGDGKRTGGSQDNIEAPKGTDTGKLQTDANIKANTGEMDGDGKRTGGTQDNIEAPKGTDTGKLQTDADIKANTGEMDGDGKRTGGSQDNIEAPKGTDTQKLQADVDKKANIGEFDGDGKRTGGSQDNIEAPKGTDTGKLQIQENVRLEKERVEKLKRAQAEGEARKAAADKKLNNAKNAAREAEVDAVKKAKAKRLALDQEKLTSQMQTDADAELKRVEAEAEKKRVAAEAEAQKIRDAETAEAERKQLQAEADAEKKRIDLENAEKKRIELETKKEVERFNKKNNVIDFPDAKPISVPVPDNANIKPNTNIPVKKPPAAAVPRGRTTGGGLAKAKDMIGAKTAGAVGAISEVIKVPDAAKSVMATGKDIAQKKMKGILGKNFTKMATKLVPGLGILTGLGFAASRLWDGDYAGAAAEGVGVFLPSVSGAGIDVALMARDSYNDYYKTPGNDFPLDDDLANNPEQAQARLDEITAMAKDMILGAEKQVQDFNAEEYKRQVAELEGQIAADTEIAENKDFAWYESNKPRQARRRIEQNEKKLEELKKTNPAATMSPVPSQSPDRGDGMSSTLPSKPTVAPVDETSNISEARQRDLDLFDADGDGKLNKYERRQRKLARQTGAQNVSGSASIQAKNEVANMMGKNALDSSAGAVTKNVVVAPTSNSTVVNNSSVQQLGKNRAQVRHPDQTANNVGAGVGSF